MSRCFGILVAEADKGGDATTIGYRDIRLFLGNWIEPCVIVIGV